VYLPKGEATKGRILGRTVNGKPVDGTLQVKGPFHLAVDQQDRIWISNAGSDTVTRFPGSDPGKAEQIEVGFGPHAIAIDSLGNAWVNNILGHPGPMEKLAMIKDKAESKIEDLFESSADSQTKMWIELYSFGVKHPSGDVSMVRPDGTVLPPFDAGKEHHFALGHRH
jgi:streptogramin lyase